MNDIKKPENPYLKTLIILIILSIVFLVMIFIPSAFGMDMMEYGFAITFVSVFLCVSFAVSFFIILGMYKRLGKILSDFNILCYWKYDTNFWKSFSEKEFKTQKKEKFFLYIYIMIISFIVLLIFALVVRDSWKIMLILFFALTFILGLAAVLAPIIRHRIAVRKTPEVYISSDGLYIAGEFHVWNYMGSKLKKVELDRENSCINLKYSFITRQGVDHAVIRIPVLPEKTDEAISIVKKLQEANNIKSAD